MVHADPVNIVLSIITYRKRRRRNLYVNKYSNVNNISGDALQNADW